VLLSVEVGEEPFNLVAVGTALGQQADRAGRVSPGSRLREY
jgi:hypothetical protein